MRDVKDQGMNVVNVHCKFHYIVTIVTVLQEQRKSIMKRKLSTQIHHSPLSQLILSALLIHGKKTGCSSADASRQVVP
jgi:hypothetical protein